jgi:hypothetical protein
VSNRKDSLPELELATAGAAATAAKHPLPSAFGTVPAEQLKQPAPLVVPEKPTRIDGWFENAVGVNLRYRATTLTGCVTLVVLSVLPTRLWPNSVHVVPSAL